MSALNIKNAKGVVIDNCTFSGFKTAISAENSDFLMSRTKLVNNQTGLNLKDSKSIIHQSLFSGNEVDIISENSTFDTIDSFISNVIVKQIDSLPKDSYGLANIKIQVSKYLSTKKFGVKKVQLKAVLNILKEGAKYVDKYAVMLKNILDLINRLTGGY